MDPLEKRTIVGALGIEQSLYRDYTNKLEGSLLTNQDFPWKVVSQGFFFTLGSCWASCWTRHHLLMRIPELGLGTEAQLLGEKTANPKVRDDKKGHLVVVVV